MNSTTHFDMGKVLSMTFWWANQESQRAKARPKGFTVRGRPVGDDPAMPHELYPGETTLQRARRLDLIDRWRPVVYVKQPCNHGLLYEGRCALEIWKAWNARVFGKRKKKEA